MNSGMSEATAGRGAILPASQPYDMRRLLLLASLLTLGLTYMPYSQYFLYPIRIFVTFIHESGHALASVISGGTVNYLQIYTNGEGVTWSATSEWASWLVISGGYLGTTLFGALMLQIGRSGNRPHAGRTALFGMGLYILVVTLLWGHNPFDNLFTLVSGLTLAVALFALARFTSPRAGAFLASFLAVQCCFNALSDLRVLFYLTTAMPGRDNDAVFMSQHYPLPPAFWALLWVALSLVILTISLRSYWRAAGGFRTPALAA